jgi:hypothetical protein
MSDTAEKHRLHLKKFVNLKITNKFNKSTIFVHACNLEMKYWSKGNKIICRFLLPDSVRNETVGLQDVDHLVELAARISQKFFSANRHRPEQVFNRHCRAHRSGLEIFLKTSNFETFHINNL